MVCAQTSFAHETRLNANRWHAERWFDPIMGIHADSADDALHDQRTLELGEHLHWSAAIAIEMARGR
jgi:hypothetical protein